MKLRSLCIAAALMAAGLAIVPMDAVAQVTGTWELSMEGPRGPQMMILVLEMDGDELTGTMTPQPPEGGGRRGGGGGPGGGGPGGGPPQMELTDATVDGDSFSFTVTMGMRGNALGFNGTVEGDEMSGTLSAARGERSFTGKRVD